uniref:Cytochrome P450 2K1-like protein n=1 Tax=Dugesia japonica TaxID=6161 RepID=A0A2U8U473_DUGJA|nr:cytochrome P450 2K1-like protein [Dugesia japonica]
MIFILSIFGLFIIWYCFSRVFKRRSIPNGLKETPIEYGWPILGIIPKIKGPMQNYLLELSRKHGPIFRIRLGMRDVVILGNYQTIRKALVDDAQIFSGRWKMKLVSVVTHDSGIVFKDGPVWSTQRSFILKVLRDFGMGKSISQDIVQGECLFLLNELDSLQGEIIDFSKIIPIYTANIISKFIMNKRFDRSDPRIKFIEYAIFQTSKQSDIVQRLHLMFPIFDKSTIISKFNLWITSKLQLFSKVERVFHDEIEEHKTNLDYNSEGDDLIDRFLLEQNRLSQSTGIVESFTDKQLIFMTFEMFGAGYETTSTTLGWSMLFMSRYKDIQKKVYEEILNVIGEERMPTMNDKKSLNYTQAVMDEILRLSSVAPLGIFHRTFNDTSVDNYFIPKNSLVFANYYACHTDPDIWLKPVEFYPEHFLIKCENDELKYSPREELIPFGIGKRQCIGESLARMEYFIFFVSILQRYQVDFSENISDSLFEETLRGNEGIIRYSKIKNFIFKTHNY